MKNFTKNVKLILFSNLIYLSISILLIATISSCSEKSDDFNPNDVVNKLSQMSDLGTVEFQFSKIMKADDEATWFKVGTRRILIKSKAYVKAGVDFSGIKINEVNKETKKISLKLPPGKIISVNIPSNDIKVVFSQYGMSRDKFSNKEIQKIQIMGEKSIYKKIKEMNLEAEASKRSKLFLENWLKISGFNEITIN
jgi:hypothetical protein